MCNTLLIFILITCHVALLARVAIKKCVICVNVGCRFFVVLECLFVLHVT